MLGFATCISSGDRYRILADHTVESILEEKGGWSMVWDVQKNRAMVRLLVGPSKGKAEWVNVEKDEGVRIQSKGPGGKWR
jgi:hypothetical protein